MDALVALGFLEMETNGYAMGTAIAIAAKFRWRRYPTFADVGTAQGGLPVELAKARRHLRGIGVDLPNVESIFEEYVEAHRLQSRIQWRAADIWSDPFPRADVIILGHILHGWGLERKKVLLRNTYEAVPKGGPYSHMTLSSTIGGGRTPSACYSARPTASDGGSAEEAVAFERATYRSFAGRAG